MISGEDNVLQFLVGLGVLNDEDAAKIKKMQIDPIIEMLLSKDALGRSDVDKAKGLLQKIMDSSNHIRRMKSQMELMHIITGKMHSRMEASRQRIHEHKERVTSGHYPAVAAMAKVASD